MIGIPIYCSPESPETFAELLGTLIFGQMCGVISFFVVFISMIVLACKGKLPFDHKVERKTFLKGSVLPSRLLTLPISFHSQSYWEKTEVFPEIKIGMIKEISERR